MRLRSTTFSNPTTGVVDLETESSDKIYHHEIPYGLFRRVFTSTKGGFIMIGNSLVTSIPTGTGTDNSKSGFSMILRHSLKPWNMHDSHEVSLESAVIYRSFFGQFSE